MPSRPRPNDSEVIKRAKQGAKLGLKYSLLAKYCGISESTLYKWIALGRVDDNGECESEDHRAFAAAVLDAESEGAAVLLARIHKASDHSWQAAAWILERRHDYTRTEQREHKVSTEINPKDLVNAAIAQLKG